MTAAVALSMIALEGGGSGGSIEISRSLAKGVKGMGMSMVLVILCALCADLYASPSP